MTDVPPVPPPSPSGGYGGLRGYGKGNFGAPPPAGGMPYEEYEYAQPVGGFGGPMPVHRLVSDASFRSRAISCTVDTLLWLVGSFVGCWLVWRFMYRASCDSVAGFDGESVYLDCSGLFAILVWPVMAGVVAGIAYLLYVRPVGRGEQSVGMRLAKVRVVDETTRQPIGRPRAAVRFVVRTFVSTLLLGLGFWWALWDPDRQTFHDKVSATTVRDQH